MRRSVFCIVGAWVCGAAGGCDSVERESPQRYYVAPDAGDGLSRSADPRDGSVAPTDSRDASVDAAVVPTMDVSSLPLSGWWRASYGGSPWVGTASAGASPGRDLTEAATPPLVGPAIQGLTPAAFDGANRKLGSTLPVGSFLSAVAWEAHGLFSATTAAPYTAGAAYRSPALLTDSSDGYFYVAFSSAGVMAGHYEGGLSFKEVVSPCPTGGLHVFQAWFDGTNLSVAVDGGVAATTPAGPPTLGLGLLKVGANYDGSARFEGRIVELLTANQLLGTAGRSQVRAYYNGRYGTTFPL